jgi:uncharacterized protein (DUF433 family)
MQGQNTPGGPMMTLPDFLVQTSHGELLLKGHRIGLQHVVHYYNEGYSPEMLLGQFPTLSLAMIHKVIGFYLEHKAPVDDYVSHCRENLDQQRVAGRHLDFAALEARLRSLQKIETPTSP